MFLFKMYVHGDGSGCGLVKQMQPRVTSKMLG